MEINLLLWGLTLGTIGKLILGIAVLRVHINIIKEHRIDNLVLTAMKKEQWVTLTGLALIVIGYICEVIFYGGTPFFSCGGADCAATIQNVFRLSF